MRRSVISSGVGLASGEFIIQPHVASLVGAALPWVAFLVVTTQFVVDMEVERYDLAADETVITSFSQIQKPRGEVFRLGTIVPNLLPGWHRYGPSLLTNTYLG